MPVEHGKGYVRTDVKMDVANTRMNLTVTTVFR